MEINERSLKEMSVSAQFQLRRQCAENRDIESLLTIAKFNFLTYGGPGTLSSVCYYYGRLHREKELHDFLANNSGLLHFGYPSYCMELAQNLFNIGLRFPYLSDEEMSYLDQRYCDPKTFELFDIIMFDSDLLSRPIRRLDKNLLKVKHSNFSIEFLSQVFNCFIANEELGDRGSKLYVYSRWVNDIIRKGDEDVGLGEFIITSPIGAKDFFNLIKDEFGEDYAEKLNKDLTFIGDPESFKTDNSCKINAEAIKDSMNKYFDDSSRVEDIESAVALIWLNKINSIDYKFY